jgi:hypothetical protein
MFVPVSNTKQTYDEGLKVQQSLDANEVGICYGMEINVEKPCPIHIIL